MRCLSLFFSYRNNIANDTTGQGSFARMKAYMNAHTENECDYMFARATEHVTNILTSMCLEVESQMVCQVDSILDCIKRDYRGVVAGVPADKAHTESLKYLREEIIRFLKEADSRFAVGETATDAPNEEGDDSDGNHLEEVKRDAGRYETAEEGDAASEGNIRSGRQRDAVSAEPINSAQSGQSSERSTSERVGEDDADPATYNDEDEHETRFFNAEADPTGEPTEALPRTAGLQVGCEDGNEEPEYDCCWPDIMSDPYDELANCCEEDYVEGEEEEEH